MYTKRNNERYSTILRQICEKFLSFLFGTMYLFNVEYWQHIQTEGIFLYRKKKTDLMVSVEFT